MGLENNLSNYEQKSVAVTFGSQLKELESQSPDCSNLLRVISFFDPEGIPLDMITEGVEGLRLHSASNSRSSDITLKLKPMQSILHKLETKLQLRRAKPTITTQVSTDEQINRPIMDPQLESLIALMSSPVQLQQAIRYLRQLSLVGYKSTEDTSALRIHDLIQIIIQERARRDGRQYHWFHVATVLACDAFRHVDDPFSHTCWAQCEMFHPHIQSLTKWDDEHTIGNSELRRANMRIGQYLRSRGRYSEAEALFRRALTSTEKLLGPEHPDSLTIVQNISSIYWRQGRYDQAEALCKRTLTGREKVLGPEHPNTLQTMHTYATVYRLQKRFVEAEGLYGRALASREKLLGPDHPVTLQTVNSLATLYHVQDRYIEAETLFRRALAGREKLLGQEHKETLATVNKLAMVYELQGRSKEAEALYGQALRGQETLLGHEHPNTLRTVQNLAHTYHLHRRWDEAETLYQRALTGREKVLGSDHPDTLVTVRELAELLKDQSRNAEVMILHKDFPLAFKSQ
jgi:tetratricopeptide (TPR) repeat protein